MLVWICPPTEMEICRRASKDQHAVHLREFAETYVRVELHRQAGVTVREIQADLIDRTALPAADRARMGKGSPGQGPKAVSLGQQVRRGSLSFPVEVDGACHQARRGRGLPLPGQ